MAADSLASSAQRSHSHQTRPSRGVTSCSTRKWGATKSPTPTCHPLPNCATGPVAGQKTAGSGHLMSLPQASIPNFHLEPPPGLPLQAPDADRLPTAPPPARSQDVG
ncbi:hypothetical protein B0T18DRAFT_179577 [Schizothecium vesticola]|uniref:Uncharacterized protein n=1 Tax=Schizothecium vesticola TaxID=314040 RepID=A0AA40EPQ3_9PEZI|nr:hypothetical protein B0T18DRAFT_179577 [Schizothecium vesticola]